MSYRTRMTAALLASLALNCLAWVWLARDLSKPPAITEAAVRTPPAVRLLPEPPTPRQLVEVHTPAEEPVQTADSIAEFDSQAADPGADDGETRAPASELLDTFDDPGGAPLPPVTSPAPEPPAREEARETPASTAGAGPQGTELDGAAEAREAAEPMAGGEPEPGADDGEEPSAAERRQVAALLEPAAPRARPTPPQAEPAPPAPPQPPRLTPSHSRSRVAGGVKNQGFLGFEAIQDEIAPYLNHIKRQVERQWVTALQLRYSGTSPTEAVVDCAIDPAGNLVEVTIVDRASTPIFAQICKDSIERAGPFGPFPFETPDIYANENLEIRWTFSFMK